MKHLICYDQDSMRDGLYTWMTEQTLREVYLKPFKIAIQEGGLSGIMTSYNRLGAVWAGGSTALISLVREEYGFEGAILTDYADHHIFMNGDQMLRAGGDLWMDGMMADGAFVYETESNSYHQALRRASKNILYIWLNAAYENRQYNQKVGADKATIRDYTQKMSVLNKIQIGWNVAAGVLVILWVVSIVRRRKKTA